MIEELKEKNYRYTSKIISNFILLLIKDLKKCSAEDEKFIKLKTEICEYFDKYEFDNIYSKLIYKYFKENKYKKAFALSDNSFFSIFKRYRRIGF